MGYFKNALKIIFAPLTTKLGYRRIDSDQVKLYSTNNLLGSFFAILKQLDFTPKHIVDVGANHGAWTRETLKYFPESFYTLLEPQSKLKASMDDILNANPKVKFHTVGAGKEKGTFKFTILDRDDSCSFSYSEEEASKMGYTQIEVPVVTLNDLLPATKLPTPDIIKIDAEGLDLDVLAGASSFFGKTEIFMVEASVMCNVYENTFLKVIAFMDQSGYRVFDFTDLNRTIKHQALWLVEIVFIKKNGALDKAIYSYN